MSREIVVIRKIPNDDYRYVGGYNYRALTYYIDKLPQYIQNKIAIIRLAPPNTYIEGVGERTEDGIITVNINEYLP